jgi:acyl phosphate:glycerol-3-phosphate acyltransferase
MDNPLLFDSPVFHTLWWRMALEWGIAYLIGSIPFGYLIVKLASGDDIRQVGSGGTGATNVSRKAGKAAGIATLVLDALKGVAIVLLFRWYRGFEAGYPLMVTLAGFWAIVGHCYPVWLRFRGGKGVATALGVFLTIVPVSVLPALLVFVFIVWRTRYVSLGSITAALVVPLWTTIQHCFLSPIEDFSSILSALCLSSTLIIWKHKDNIKRLATGLENKFGEAK